MDIVRLGETERLAVVATDGAGAGITGATVIVEILRDSNSYWWNGTAFASAHATNAMTETSAANLPGVYHYDFTPPVTDFTCILYFSTTTGTVMNFPQVRQLRVGSWSDEITEVLDALDESVAITISRNSLVEAAIERLSRKVSTVIERLVRLVPR